MGDSIMSKANWQYTTTKKTGNVFGSNLRSQLDVSIHKREALLAREVLQNCCDAQNNKNDKVRIIIRKLELTGQLKKEFISNLKLNEIGKRKNVISELSHGNMFNDDDDEGSLNLLFIEDFNTHGLYGSMDDEHFEKASIFKLLIQPGDADKNFNMNDSGGSHGVGKAALSANSKIFTIAAYSNFNDKYISDAHKENKNYIAKDSITHSFMASSYLSKHKFEKTSYTGRVDFHNGKNAEELLPIYNKEAEEIAEKLHFTKRSESEIGTSVVLIDCDLDLDKIRAAIEDFWWPKIIDQEIDIEMYECFNQNVNKIDPPRPKLRASLKPFIKAYEKIQKIGAFGQAEVKNQQNFSVGNFNISKPGTTAMEAVPESDMVQFVNDESKDISDEFDDGDRNYELTKINKVALIRNPKMVINYFNIRSSAQDVFAVGVYKASHEDKWVDKILKYSENQSHEKWDPGFKRLSELRFDDDTPMLHGSQFVSKTLNHIKRTMQGFLNDLKRKDKPIEDYEITKLGKLLGNLFKLDNNSGTKLSPTEARPISISYYEHPKIKKTSDGDSQIIATIDLSVSDSFLDDHLELIFEPKVFALGSEEEKIADIKISGIKLDENCKGIDFSLGEGKGGLLANLTINKGKEYKARLEIISEKYDRLWTVKIDPQVSVEGSIK